VTSVRIACAQLTPRVGDLEWNRAHAKTAIRSLAAFESRVVLLPELAATSQEVRDYADQLGAPYCGPIAPFESRDWFDTGETMQSFAFLPMRTAYTFGLLALGDEDGERFHPGMGTVYLTRLAELASVSTSRYLPPA